MMQEAQDNTSQSKKSDSVEEFMKSFNGKWRWRDAFTSTKVILLLAALMLSAGLLVGSDAFFIFACGLSVMWGAVFLMCAVGNRMGPPYWSDPRLFKCHQALLKSYIIKRQN